MCRLFPLAFWVFALGYAFALAVFAIGYFGLFGQARDALAGVFLVMLGWPWLLMADAAPERWRPWVALLSPALNLALLGLVARFVRRAPGGGSV